MDEKARTFIINSIATRDECRRAVGYLDTNKGAVVMICTKRAMATNEQKKFFYSLLQEFVRVGQEADIGGPLDNNIEWWKGQIKDRAEFYKTTKGERFDKARAREIYEELKNKVEPSIRNDIIKALSRQYKSIKDATSEEVGKMIDALLSFIAEYIPQEILMTSEHLTATMLNRYNSIKSGGAPINRDNENMLALLEKHYKFIFSPKTNTYIFAQCF